MGGTSLYGNVVTVESLQVLFMNADPMNAFAMRGNFGMVEMYGETTPILGDFWGLNPPILSVVLTIIGISSLLFIKRMKFMGYFAILFTISIFLSAGPRFASDLSNWFIFETPLSSLYGWAFRTPKFTSIAILALSPMIALTGIKLLEYLKQNKIVAGTASCTFVGFVLVVSLLPNYPIVTGDFNGIFQSAELPQEYEEAVSYLSTRDNGRKTVWGYPYAGTPSTWYTNRLGVTERDLSPLPVSLNNLNYDVLFGNRLRYDSLMFSHDVTNVGKFFQPLNVGYILVHNDIPWLKTHTEKLFGLLDAQNDLDKVFEEGFITIYDVKHLSDLVSIKEMNVIIQGGLEKYNSLSLIETFDPNRIGVLYEAFGNVNNAWKYTDILVTDHRPVMVPAEHVMCYGSFC